jgi:LETM1 and EF-hand domain-containing protein 1
MRSMDLTQFRLRKQLQEWLDLSIQKNIPISLMIMSRALNLSTLSTEDTAATVLKSSISSLDADMLLVFYDYILIINKIVLMRS